MDIREFIKNFVARNFFFVKMTNTKEVSDPIVSELKKLPKEYPSVSEEDISEPIVSALEDVKKAIQEKEAPEEMSISNLDSLQSEIGKAVSFLSEIASKEEKEIKIEKIDLKPIITAIKGIKIPEQKIPKDYSAELSEIYECLEEFKNKKINLSEIINFLNKKENILISIIDWLKEIYGIISKEKESEFRFDKDGKLLVNIGIKGFGGGGGIGLTTGQEAILSSLNNKIPTNPATEENQDPTSAYSISDLDEASSTKYYGYLKADGGWYILKLTSTEARYAKGASGYNWANRASETYDTFANTF